MPQTLRRLAQPAPGAVGAATATTEARTTMAPDPSTGRAPSVGADKLAGVLALGALLFLVAVRSGFRGALGD